jgi:hypothetical protein
MNNGRNLLSFVRPSLRFLLKELGCFQPSIWPSVKRINMEENQICEKCKYWLETGGTDAGLVGECHRNAPYPELIDAACTANIRYAVWPVTADKNWCGKFEDRPMATSEVLAQMAMIEKMEAARRGKTKET